MMTHPIQKRIADREALIAKIEEQMADLATQRARHEAEIAAYRDALQFVLPKAERPRRDATSSGRRGGVGEVWKGMIAAVSGNGVSEFTTDDVLACAELKGFDVQRATVRTQCANFVNAGYLSRIANGRFVVTDKGRDVFVSDADAQTKTPVGEDRPAFDLE